MMVVSNQTAHVTYEYPLDADTLIDYLKDRGNARLRITAMIEAADEIALCAITVEELYSGLSDKNRGIWESWLMALPYWHISKGAPTAACRLWVSIGEVSLVEAQ